MTFYIAQFKAHHRVVQVEQHSIFIWKQEGGDIDPVLLENKIKRESSVHFFQMLTGAHYTISEKDISVSISKTEPYSG